MYFITTKRMLEVCFSAHPNIQYRTVFLLFSDLYTRRKRYTVCGKGRRGAGLVLFLIQHNPCSLKSPLRRHTVLSSTTL